MDGIWIDKVIMALKRTPSEAQLLAAICYRAAGSNGLCTDSNRELGDLINVHYQTVSTLVTKIENAGFVVSAISATQANLRTLKPMSVLLTPYEQNAHRWREKKKNPYERNTHSNMSETLIDSEQITQAPMSETLTPYEQNAHSLYKEEKSLEKEIEKKGEIENENPSLTFASEEILSIEAEEVIPVLFDAEKNQSPPFPQPPPDSGDFTPEDIQEFEEINTYQLKLCNDRRLMEMLSRLNKIKGQEAIDWVCKFVTRQWGANNLIDRPHKDLVFHCQSWIEQQLNKPQPNEQPTRNNNRRRQGNSQSLTETGSELDDLAAQYFGT